MKFDDPDARLRMYETAHDLCVLPGLFMVARIDGRNFTRLTKETHQFEAPYDTRFRDCMVATLEYLMACGFRSVYDYTQSILPIPGKYGSFLATQSKPHDHIGQQAISGRKIRLQARPRRRQASIELCTNRFAARRLLNRRVAWVLAKPVAQR